MIILDAVTKRPAVDSTSTVYEMVALALVMFVLVAIAQAVGMFVSPSAAAEPSLGDSFRFFKDEAEAPWAIHHLARTSARGLLAGYPDGRFRPNDGVRRVEVVVAVMRLIEDDGDEAPAGEALAALPDGDEILRGYPWAAEAVNRATYLGAINVDEPLRPGIPATRAWIAELLVRALGLEDQAQEEMSGILPFLDSNDVPPEKTGYVAVVNRRCIMIGYQGMFEPLKNISRAEFATVLDRASEIVGPAQGLEIRGRVMAVDSKKASISMRVFDREWWKRVAELGYWDRGDLHSGDATVQVAKDATIILDDKEIPLSSLKKDHVASIVWNAQGFAVLVDADSKQRVNWPETGKSQKEGTIIEARPSGPPLVVFRDSTGLTQAYGIADSCKVKRDGKTAEIADLDPGDRVKLKLADFMITSIEAEKQEETLELEGVVKSISLGRRGVISLADDTGARREFEIGTECRVTRSDRASNLVEVRYGDRVNIRVTGDEVTRITVIPKEGMMEIEGVVREIELGSESTIRVRDAQMEDRSFALSPYCVAKCGGRVIELHDVHVNDLILLELEKTSSTAGWMVRTLTVRVTDEAGGWVETVEADSAPPRIKVRLYSGSSLYAWMLPTARVWRKGKAVEIRDIGAGDRVRMSLIDGVATSLEVEDSLSAIEGVVEEAEAKRHRLTVRPQGESPITLTLADGARITYAKQPADLTIVQPGDRVQVKVKNGLAAGVDVEDRVPREVVGRVTRVSAGAAPKIWVKPATGSAQNYALAADVKVEYEGLPLKPAEILGDDSVSLVVYGSRVTRVVIEKRVSLEVQGSIVSALADLLEGYSIRIRNDKGNVVTYRVMDNVPIKKGSASLEWSDLKENDVVNLKLAGNVVTRITVLE